MQTYFTDTEYRLLLLALSREMKVCKEVDKECTDRKQNKMTLEDHMNSLEHKIRILHKCHSTINGENYGKD